MKNTTLTWIVGVVAVVALIGAYNYPRSTNTTVDQFGSTAGTTLGTAKFGGITVNLGAPGANATSSSILNGDAGDRYISALKVGCEVVGTSQTAYTGAGLASLTVFAATTTTAAPASVSNTNKIGGGNITIATSTAFFAQSTSTIGVGQSNPYFVWPSGAYLTFTTNATNTALCTFGADYFQS